jgi:glycerol-3-phosphate O-acyltransferase
MGVIHPDRVLADKWDEDHFDSEHCQHVAPRIKRLILTSYSTLALSKEAKQKILDLGTTSIIYASLHKSHFDYIAICGEMLLEGLPCPRTVAGRNLLGGMIGSSVKYFTGIDMMKWGAIPIERGSTVPRTISKLYGRMELLLKMDKPILTFPEVEPTSKGNGNSIKTGRAYKGKIREFAPALFSPAINVAKDGKKVYVVPIAVSYDFVAEDSYFSRLSNAERMKKSNHGLIFLIGKFYYKFLESHFFFKMYSLGRGNIYIDIGQPIPVEPNSSKKELAHLAQEEAARCYRVTMPALVAYAISKGSTSRVELQKSMERYATMLKEVKANFQPYANLQESVEGALQGLAGRKIISADDSISVRKPDIIRYYANTIAHYLS